MSSACTGSCTGSRTHFGGKAVMQLSADGGMRNQFKIMGKIIHARDNDGVGTCFRFGFRALVFKPTGLAGSVVFKNDFVVGVNGLYDKSIGAALHKLRFRRPHNQLVCVCFRFVKIGRNRRSQCIVRITGARMHFHHNKTVGKINAGLYGDGPRKEQILRSGGHNGVATNRKENLRGINILNHDVIGASRRFISR